MKGRVDPNSIGLGSSEAVREWRIQPDEGGEPLACIPSPDQHADRTSLLMAGFRVEYELLKHDRTCLEYARITAWAGHGQWPDGGHVRVANDRGSLRVERTPKPVETSAPVPSEDRFVNPYNFVALGEKRRDAEGPTQHGGFGPPDASLSGWVDVRLEVLTPLLIPDPEGTRHTYDPETVAPPEGATPGELFWYATRKIENKTSVRGPFESEMGALRRHPDWDPVQLKLNKEGRMEAVGHRGPRATSRSASFFRLGDTPAIPLSSLRGAIRSLYEAATDSCLSQFDSDKTEGWRPNLDKKGQRKEYLEDNVNIRPGRVKSLPTQQRAGQIELADEWFRAPFGKPRNVFGTDLDHEELYKDRQAMTRGAPVFFTTDPDSSEYASRVSRAEFSGSRRGLLKMSGRMGDYPGRKPRKGDTTKRNEIVLVFSKQPDDLKLTKRTLDEYEHINGDGAVTRLEPGQLVWVRSRGDDIVSLGRGYIHKVPCTSGGRRITYSKRLPNETYLPCSETAKGIDQLCPACAAFGTVLSKDASDAAYGGRVSVGTARLDPDGPCRISDRTIRDLRSPRPQSGFFYLRETSGNAVPDWRRSNSLIAGRKVYVHSVPFNERVAFRDKVSDAQVEVMEAGSFMFRVRFKDLRRWELGALLWCLEPHDPVHEDRKLEDGAEDA